MTDHQNTDGIKRAAPVEELVVMNGDTTVIGRGIDEADDRPIPDQFPVECAISDMLDALEMLAADTKLADHVADIASSFTTSIHYQLKNIERKFDSKRAELAALVETADGSEVKDVETQRQHFAATDLGDRLEMFETLRDVLVANINGRYRANWTPPRGSLYSRNRKLTQTQIEARDFIKASQDAERAAKMPTGTKIGFSGGNDYNDSKAIWDCLDKVKTRFPDMVLVHGGGRKGAELIAAKWAQHRDVAQIVFVPEWKAHGKAAPFRRNDEMLKIGLAGVIVTPGTGIQENMADKAAEKRVKVHRLGIAPRHVARGKAPNERRDVQIRNADDTTRMVSR